MKALGAALVLLPGLATAQTFGPLQVRNQRALSLPFLRLDPRNSILSRGERSFSFDISQTNDFRQVSPGLFEDQETVRIQLDYRKGIGEGLELGVRLPLYSRGGGILDPIIDWWHENVLGWSDQGRNNTPFGGSTITFPGGGQYGSATGFGDLDVSLTKRIDRRTLGTIAVKLPTGNQGELFGSGNVDGGLSLYYSGAIRGPWSYSLQAGFVAQGKAPEWEGTRGLVHQEGIALIYNPNSRDAWIAQWQGESAAIQTGLAGSDATHRVITFGYQRRLSDSKRLDLFFTEDRDLFNNAWPEGANIGPDFTMGIRLNVKF